jgi:hypothetical protein
MYRRVFVLAALLLGLAGCSTAQTRGQAADESEREDPDLKIVTTIGDVTEVGPLAPRPVSGVGLVCGLEGTGGGVPAGDFRGMLEKQLQQEGVQNVQELLASPNYAVVLVSSAIPVGVRKGDPLDIEVTLPPQSRATSLRGGNLRECMLKEFNLHHGEQLQLGHTLAQASGPLLVGCGGANEEIHLNRGRIWGGGMSHIDSPFSLYLKNDQKFARVAGTIVNRINLAFPDDAQKQYLARQTKRLLVLDEVTSGINEKFHSSNGLGRGETAYASGKEMVSVNVPLEYHLNVDRFLRVVRLIPLRDTPETSARYRKRLEEMLLEPKNTVAAAVRLEALGKESIPVLQTGLTSSESLVRFASSEALAYLGSTAGIEELGRLAAMHETLRGLCLTAMASVNESRSQVKLAELMKSSNTEVRIGAFRGLLTMSGTDLRGVASAEIRGELFNDAFWLHHVAPLSPPLVHISTNHRAEIVIFGEAPVLVPPLRLAIGSEFTVAADAGDDKCIVSRFVVNAGKHGFKPCSCKLEDVLETLAEMGGQYPDALELLRTLQRNKCLSCAVAVDALPAATSIELLAAAGSDVSRLKDQPELQQELQAIQQDLGIVPSPANPSSSAVRPQR